MVGKYKTQSKHWLVAAGVALLIGVLSSASGTADPAVSSMPFSVALIAFIVASVKYNREKKERGTKPVAKKENKLEGVEGWLAFFIFTLVLSIIVNIVVFFVDVTDMLTLPDFLPSDIVLGILFDAALLLGASGMAAYAIYVLTKRTPNAISTVKWYLALVFLVQATTLVVDWLAGGILLEEAYFGMDATAATVRSLIYSVIWLTYFGQSKRVDNTYPEKKRQSSMTEKLAFFIILGATIVFYVLFIIGINTVEEAANPYQEVELQRSLTEGEYSDGVIYFTPPDDLSIEKEYDGIYPYFSLYEGEEIGMSLMSFSTEGYTREQYFSDFFQGSLESVSGGYELDYEDFINKQSETGNNLEYTEKTLLIHGEDDFLFGVVMIFDTSSDITAALTYFAPYDDASKVNSYKRDIVNSIEFVS